MVAYYFALEVHESLGTGCHHRHGLDPGLVGVGLAVGDHSVPNLDRERHSKRSL